MTHAKLFACAMFLLPAFALADGERFTQREEVIRFIGDMVKKHGFEQPRLFELFDAARLEPRIIETISRPAESKPWYQYRPIFLQEARVEGGVKFWETHSETLARAEARYGVPAQIVTAIVGVETRYGQQRGGYRVIDALATLAFDYPPRGDFFRGELEQYLLLTREENWDALAINGSYAGAMGQPQFISSSYRRYAVDFDGDGKRDLWENTADIIGSVANFLSVHGWRRGGPVATPATVKDNDYKTLLEQGVKPHTTLAEFKRQGVNTAEKIAGNESAALMEFELENGAEEWLGFNNFYVITRYNRSPLYAMAVYQLSEEIRARRGGETVTPVWQE